MQLVAYGHEDIFLTTDPQITYFKVVYRRHTNFSDEPIKITFSNQDVTFGKKITTHIKKNGDLLGDIIVSITLPAIKKFNDNLTKFAWVKKIGYSIIKTVEIEINGKIIDRHYGEWLSLFSELCGDTGGNYDKFNDMIGNIPILTDYSNSKPQYTLHVPLKFWFCRSIGLTLPILALQYSDVKLNIEFNDANLCYKITPTHFIQCQSPLTNFIENEYIEQKISNTDIRCGIFNYYDVITSRLYYYKISKNKIIGITTTTQDLSNPTITMSLLSNNQNYRINGITSKFYTYANFNGTSSIYPYGKIRNLNLVDCHLVAKYYFLDDDERKKFLELKHDYIIEQLYYTPTYTLDSINNNVSLVVEQPCKLLVWITQQDYIAKSLDLYNYTDSYIDNKNSNNIILNETILLNGLTRLSLRSSNYFNYTQPFQHCKYSCSTGVNIYNFGLSPCIVQPTGTCNMSQINTLEIQMQLSSIININNIANFRCYALCYQILRVSNGICSPVFVK